jgi:hypothetical protein
MNRRLRIGLIAEGQTELGHSIPYINPEDGGKVIAREQEGALHILIRRELQSVGLTDCDFVQRHPSIKEMRKGKVSTGFGILDCKYLAQIVSPWKPEEIDLIVIVADADDKLEERQKSLKMALETIQKNHLDNNENEITDQSCGGLAIRNFETWLIADSKTVSSTLELALLDLADLELLEQTKDILETAIAHSVYLCEQKNRSMIIRWHLAEKINLEHLKKTCPQGYGTFVQELIAIAQRFSRKEINFFGD